MNTTMTEQFITLQFSDNVKIKLSTSSFLYKESKLFKILEIDTNDDITSESSPTSLVPILCPSSYVLDDKNISYFDDKTDISFMFTLDTSIFIKLCHFLDVIEYETNEINELFILYVMKHNIMHQLKYLHVFMCAEIKSILNYTENECIDIQVKTCTPLFFKLYLSEYKEEVIKYGRIDIYNDNITEYYKYIHKYYNQLTYIVKETQEYKDYVVYITNQLFKECKKKNNIKQIKELVEHGIDINVKNNNDNTALHKACKQPHNIEVIKYLIKHGANVNLKNNYGNTALHNASYIKNNIDVIEYLVEHGANVNLQNNCCETVLHNISREEDNYMIIKYLVEHGAVVNIQNDDGDTALHYASEREDNLDVIQYLVEHGANINLQNNDGHTALHHASANEDIKVIKYLVKHGANFNLKNNDGTTALDIALDTKDSKVIKKMYSAFSYKK